MNLPQQPSEIALIGTEKSRSGYSSVENSLPIVIKNLSFTYLLHSDFLVLQNFPDLRSHMALVPQTKSTFPATVTVNITYGLPASSPLCTQVNIEAAARSAEIHEFIAS